MIWYINGVPIQLFSVLLHWNCYYKLPHFISDFVGDILSDRSSFQPLKGKSIVKGSWEGALNGVKMRNI